MTETFDKKVLSEQDIRTKFITPAIVQAGWDVDLQVREEFQLTAGRVQVRGILVSRAPAKRADYVLFHKPNIPIAVVGAKDNKHRMSCGTVRHVGDHQTHPVRNEPPATAASHRPPPLGGISHPPAEKQEFDFMIPDYQTLMLPVLRVCADGKEHTVRDITDAVVAEFALTPEEQKALLPSGRQTVIANRAGWARTYLKKAGLVDSPRRGRVLITDRGENVLRQNPEKINVAFLSQFQEFVEFNDRSKAKEPSQSDNVPVEENRGNTPEEAMEAAYQELRGALADELLERVKGCSPGFFEVLVVELLVAMGYGGSRKDAGQRLGKSHDGGIDGIIKEDRLGLDVIYLQAKRWDNTIGRPEIQKFVGALQGQRARKGVFITTSTFSKDAHDYAANLEAKVILMDGQQLAQFMIDFDIGASKTNSYEVKRVDMDFFEED